MTAVLRATASGEQHGLINTLTNSVEFNDFKHMRPDIKAKIEKEKKEDAKLVEVEYLNARGRHERLTKPYCKYAGDPILVYHLIPGQRYTLPMGMINEVNNMKTIRRSGLVSLDGEDVKKDGSPLESDQDADWTHKLIPTKF